MANEAIITGAVRRWGKKIVVINLGHLLNTHADVALQHAQMVAQLQSTNK